MSFGDAISIAITNGSTILAARSALRQRWIRRDPGRANVLRAFLGVHRQIRIVDGRCHASVSIALFQLAIARGLILKLCSGGREIVAAHAGIACTRRAFRIHTGAIVARVALDANAGAAESAPVFGARRRFENVHVGGDAIDAGFVGTIGTVIKRHIGVVYEARDGAHAITRQNLAIPGGLSWKQSSRRLVTHCARTGVAGTGLACGILTRTSGGHDAFHARSAAITKAAAILIAGGPGRQEWVVCNSSRTRLARARIPIVRGKIGIFGANRDGAGAIALRLSAIADSSFVHERTIGRVLHAARSGNACSRATNRILSQTVRRRIATHADALAIANEVLVDAAQGPRLNVRKGRGAIITGFNGAFEAIIRHVVIIRYEEIVSRYAQGLIAIAGVIDGIGGRNSIERRIHAKTGLAGLCRARILIIARFIGITRDAAACSGHSSRAAHASGASHASRPSFPTAARCGRRSDRRVIVKFAAIELGEQFASGGHRGNDQRHPNRQCTSILIHKRASNRAYHAPRREPKELPLTRRRIVLAENSARIVQFPTSLQQRNPK